ncbi:von Willebrand factor type A domain-containing protein [Segetibacter sp.]|uniref:YfbK domain-containing protein n=1 Tax=Segetibacter sp. TaxID=2231182 RepID=UPI00260AA964|nr:von Willebrand factor type A domain-containing protein [Segetibacter sp.]MCW3081432.1 von Willebrand factor type [Segetibacter sp.]
MRLLALIIFLLLITATAQSQYYLRGELKDEKGTGLQGARITLFSKGTYPFITGSSGTFGIPTSLKVDTITFYLPGYDTLKTAVVTTEYGHFTLKSTTRKATSTTLQLASFTKNLHPSNIEVSLGDGETYSSTIENPFVPTKSSPETGFAIHVNRASYSNIRRFLNQKEKPPADAVRIEEMLNYFNLRTKGEINQEQTFSFNSNVTECPWNKNNRLLFINLKAKKINLDNTPPANLIFLIDVSASMDMPNRLPLLKSAFKLLSENLRTKDQVSIVTYGDQVTELLQATSGLYKQQIIEAIEGLRPHGSTPGASAIRTAYKLAKRTFIPNGNNRVILATDGDFNVGQTSEKDLEDLISQESKAGIYLTCLGVGMGNYKDSKLELLAKKGHGNFAYLDNESEAEKVLVEEFAQTIYTVANNVFLIATFDANLVEKYRLIGFDNKKSAVADKATVLQGGEVGSGHSLLAVFEIVLNPSKATDGKGINELPLTSLQLSYKVPGNNETIKEKYNAVFNYQTADSCLRFASSVIMFGILLKQSEFSNSYSWDDLYNLATSSANRKDLLQMEFVDLISKAKKLYPKTTKKKSTNTKP